MILPVDSKDDVKVARQPSRSPMNETYKVSPIKGRFDLILIGRNDRSENGKILRDYSSLKLVRITRTKDTVLQRFKPAILVN